ncbi:MAG: cytochrome c biogenesis protein CcdA, partial [Anaerolineae bacterium]|nr:cytochrome c biogenesis protein CcdA [Anaerolineae bacterium]
MQQNVMARSAGPWQTRYTTFFHAFLFVLGFSVVFVVGWGGAATVFGRLFDEYRLLLARVGGIVVIVFGLVTLGVVKWRWFYADTRPQWQANPAHRSASSLFMGVVFAAGWTPCIGTTLGAILTLGVSGAANGQAMFLASGYALGLGIPFLFIGMAMNRALLALKRLRPHMRRIQIANGVLLILIGLLLLSGRMTLVAIWAQQNGLFLDLPLGASATPTYFIAVLAGLLSF